MAAVVGLDELIRAAEAAGFAMAAPEDELAALPLKVPVSKIISVEDLARGAREVKMSAPLTAAVSTLRPADTRTGGPTMRETVYGYLGFGAPASVRA
jgi:hypothetical protein